MLKSLARSLRLICVSVALSPASYAQSATGTALIRHAPSLNGSVEGSIQQMTAENVTLNGGASVTGDLLVPGTPTVQLNGTPTYGGTLDGNGLTDAQEILNIGSNPASVDSDSGGLPDKYEAANGLKPALADDFEDADGDGYPNGYEYRATTNPQDAASIPNADFLVDPAGGGTHTTIQAAINALTKNYQIIRVNPGIYDESINLFRWPALIISSQGAGRTIIDGAGIRRCVTLQAESALVGFHVQNGGTDRTGTGNGVSISAFNANKQTLLQGCAFSNNRSVDGGAINVASSKRINVIVRRCTFLNNFAAEGGSALSVLSFAPSCLRVFIEDSILWDQQLLELKNDNSTITVKNSIVRGGYPGTNVTAFGPVACGMSEPAQFILGPGLSQTGR